MTVGDQLLHGFVKAPGVLFKLPGRAWLFVLLYLVLAGALLGGLGGALLANEEGLKRLVFAYLFPVEWHEAAEILVHHFLASQQKDVLVNALVLGSLMLVSLVLFPVKEKLSQSIETAHDLCPGRPFEEHPLWFQGFEEIKLTVLYITSFLVVFWIGYHPDTWRKVVATILSYGFLFFTYAVDFGAPLMQRHRVRYSQVIKAIFKRPLASFGFGALFALPPVIVAHIATRSGAGWSLAAIVGLIFAVEVISIIWAAAAGTHLGAQLLPTAEASRPSHVGVRIATWLVILGALGGSGYVLANLGSSVHHKSQLLKCSYTLDTASFELETPSLDGFIGSGSVDVGASFVVEIHNPTDVDVELEDNRLEVTSGETSLATTELAPMKVAAGERVEQRVRVVLKLRPTALLKGARLLSDQLRVTFYLKITNDIEFPVYIN